MDLLPEAILKEHAHQQVADALRDVVIYRTFSPPIQTLIVELMEASWIYGYKIGQLNPR